MATVSFNDGDGIKRFTDVRGGGTQADPYVFIFRFPDGYSVPLALDANTVLRIRDGSVSGNMLSIDSNGVITAKYTDEVAAATPSSTAGFIGLIRGLWTSVNQLGNAGESANSIGSIHAKLRFLINDTIGTTAQVADGDGSLMARYRLQSMAFKPQNTFTRFGTSTTDTITATPGWFLGGFIHNRSSSMRYFQIFNRTTNPTSGATAPTFSIPLAPQYMHSFQPESFGSTNGYFCSAGIAWGFSSAENTYVAASASDVNCNFFWRSA